MTRFRDFFDASRQRVTIAYMLPLALAACGQPAPMPILPPASLATCADEPTPPLIADRDGTAETQLVRDKATLEYILRLRGAGVDCRAKVHGLATWMESMK